MTRILWLSLLFFMTSVSFRGHAAQVDDIRILIDVSGSMVRTDPNNLRAPALRMLTGLLPAGASAGVWTFGRYVNMEVKWGSVDDQWRKLADSGVKKIHSRGQFTNIEGALKRASSGWTRPDPKARRNIILLTDGEVDISKQADENRKSRERLLSKIVPDLASRGARVHAIALSDRSDEALLQRIAVETDGSFEVARSAKDLQRIFLHMFERAAQPDTVPLEGNRFTIDNSIREMTLLVFRKTPKPVRLYAPDGGEYSQTKPGPQARWRSDQGYDLITVSDPAAGEWRLDAEVDEDNRVMIVTDLKLVVAEIPAYTTPDRNLDLHVELHNENKKISKNSFLKFVDFRLTHKLEDNSQLLPLQLKDSREIADKGIYLQTIAAPLSEGSHELVVSADARTFSRSKRLTVEVRWPVTVDIEPGDQPGYYELLISPRPEYLQPDSLRLQVQAQPPDGGKQPVAMLLDNDQWRGTIDASKQAGTHQLQIDLQARNRAGQLVEHQLIGHTVTGVSPKPVEESFTIEEKPVEDVVDIPQDITANPDADNDSGMMLTLIVLGVVNLLLIGGGIGAFIYLRRKRLPEEFNLMVEEGGEAA